MPVPESNVALKSDKRKETIKSIHEKLELLPTSRLQAVLDLVELHSHEVASNLDPDISKKEREDLYDHLHNKTWCKLSPSKVCEGCGVFAIRDIPAGTDPFSVCNEHRRGKQVFVTFSDSALAKLGPVTQQYIEDFMAPHTRDDDWKPQRDKEGSIQRGILLTGMNTLDISWYVNHANEGNLMYVDGEEGEFNGMATKRLIKAGEELLMNYREIGKWFYAKVKPDEEALSDDSDAGELCDKLAQSKISS